MKQLGSGEEAAFVAIDLGASSGRVIRGRFGSDQFEFEEVRRFKNGMHQDGATLRWSTRDLFGEIVAALRQIGATAGAKNVVSIGVDTWGVDYGLLDGNGELIEEPVAYRDARTEGAFERVFPIVSREEIYRATGIQLMAINTLFQLHAHVHSGAWPRNAVRLLTMPDLFHHLLCGSDAGEFTHATTTQLVRHDTKDWDRDLCRRLGIPASILPQLVPPGTKLGRLRGELARATGLDCDVVAPGSHDTASAVAATPLSERTAYVSSGTWSLVGVELPEPLVDDETLQENCTNEGGVAGTTRFLKNVTGLWILEGCRKSWKQSGRALSWEELDAAIARAPAWAGVIAPDDPAFFNPPDMVAAVRGFLQKSGQPAPDEPGALARIVLESLALRCAEVLGTVARLTGRSLRAVRVIGGGSRNDFLNQALADVTDLEILAGPAEATAIGNLLVQAVAAGRFRDLAAGRAYVAQMLPAKRFYARGDPAVEPAIEKLRRQLGGTNSFK